MNSAVFSHSVEVAPAVFSPEEDVQLWMADLDSVRPNEMREFVAALDAAERARAVQFRFERDRQRYVAARGILRRLIGTELEIPPATVVFKYGRRGKPEIDAVASDGKILRFNQSHAAGRAMFALTWDRKVGIDIEASEHLARSGGDICDLASHILSPRELVIWRALPNDSARHLALLRAWTRKEAYIKAMGEDLLDQLQSIEVALDAAAPQPSHSMRNDWIVHDLAAPAGFAAAIAVEETKPRS
jgi:4'-phosphopantetheinyl transferase